MVQEFNFYNLNLYHLNQPVERYDRLVFSNLDCLLSYLDEFEKKPYFNYISFSVVRETHTFDNKGNVKISSDVVITKDFLDPIVRFEFDKKI